MAEPRRRAVDAVVRQHVGLCDRRERSEVLCGREPNGTRPWRVVEEEDAHRRAQDRALSSRWMAEPTLSDQARIDEENASFWDELCGSSLARSLGIESADQGSLRRFDEEYMRIYPYLWRYLDLDSVRGRRVLEIGLGF